MFDLSLEQFNSLSFGLKKSLIKKRLRANLPWPIRTELRQPIFVVGSSRSGTSILAHVLAGADVVNFSEAPIVRHKMWRMVKSPSSIPNQLPDLEKILVRLSGARNGQRVIEKSPGHSLLASYILNYFSDAKLVHIVRDGRDVASSMLGHKWISRELNGEIEVFWLSRLPKFYQEQWQYLDSWERGVLRWAVYVMSARQAKAYTGRYIEVSYKDMCQNPQQVINEVLHFLQLSSTPKLENRLLELRPGSVDLWKKKGLTQNQQSFYDRCVVQFGLTQ